MWAILLRSWCIKLYLRKVLFLFDQILQTNHATFSHERIVFGYQVILSFSKHFTPGNLETEVLSSIESLLLQNNTSNLEFNQTITRG